MSFDKKAKWVEHPIKHWVYNRSVVIGQDTGPVIARSAKDAKRDSMVAYGGEPHTKNIQFGDLLVYIPANHTEGDDLYSGGYKDLRIEVYGVQNGLYSGTTSDDEIEIFKESMKRFRYYGFASYEGDMGIQIIEYTKMPFFAAQIHGPIAVTNLSFRSWLPGSRLISRFAHSALEAERISKFKPSKYSESKRKVPFQIEMYRKSEHSFMALYRYALGGAYKFRKPIAKIPFGQAPIADSYTKPHLIDAPSHHEMLARSLTKFFMSYEKMGKTLKDIGTVVVGGGAPPLRDYAFMAIQQNFANTSVVLYDSAKTNGYESSYYDAIESFYDAFDEIAELDMIYRNWTIGTSFDYTPSGSPGDIRLDN